MPAQVMGILNVTPDSFSDGGRYLDVAAAVTRGREMIDEGADIVDVGGESTRPGAEPLDVDAELGRVIPVIEALASSVRVSVDTRKPEVARQAIAAGATLVNDVSASLHEVAARGGVGWVAVHMQGDPTTMQQRPEYDDVVGEVRNALVTAAARADDAGVPEVWIDPGIGFGKTMEHNLELLARIDELVATGLPVLLGTSRKATLGQLLAQSDGVERVDPDDRLEGSLATATWALAHGVAVVRVHDVAETVQAVQVVGA